MGAIGRIGGVFIDENGNNAYEAGQKPSGLTYDDLKQAVLDPRARVILIAGADVRRSEAVAASIKGELCDVLVADRTTLNAVGKLLKLQLEVKEERLEPVLQSS